VRRAAVLAAVLVASCTPAEEAGPPLAGPAPSPAASPTATRTVIPVVAPGAEQSIVDGLMLGADHGRLTLDVTDEGAVSELVRDALAEEPPAILVVASIQASVDAVIEARPDIETARVPVIVLGTDLYTERALHRYLFQTAVPLRWQARVLAHYLASDRKYDRVMSWDAIAGAALREEGVQPVSPGGSADAALALVRISSAGGSAEQLALSSQALAFSSGLPPGTVACYPYTWAGWAAMIPRVARFRDRFAARFGRPPVGFEQEGYDAVRVLAEALDRTGGRGGDELVGALESFREEAYSSVPVRLGPDDHVFAEESQLGLFSVAGPDERAALSEAVGAVPWRPIMRTFTTDGQKVNLLDRDKKVFFPGWHRMKPSPRYWKSRFGIVTRPDEDPLH
jgi:hypothetical protein